MRGLVRGLKRGWTEANITKLVKPQRVSEAVSMLVDGDSEIVAKIPNVVGLGPEAVAMRLLETRIKAGAVKDLIEAQAGMLLPLRAISAAIADVIVDIRRAPPARADRRGDMHLAMWIAGHISKMLVDWVESSRPSFGPRRRRETPAQRDLDRIGALVGNEGKKAALVIGWIGALEVTHQAVRGQLRGDRVEP